VLVTPEVNVAKKKTEATKSSAAPDLIPGMGQIGDVAATWVSIDFVKRWDRNPRINAATVPFVVESIKRFGFGAPLVCRSSGVLIAGDTRIQAAHQLGLKAVPVRVMDHLGDSEADALALADNKAAEASLWNPGMLAEVLRGLDASARQFAGFNERETQKLFLGLDSRATKPGEVQFSNDEIIEAAFAHYRASGFPYRRLALWECMRELNELALTESPIGTNLGYAVADTYHPHRMSAAAEDKRAPVESFGIDTSLRKAITLAVENGSSVLSKLQLVNGTQACANFRPGFALQLYRRFSQPSDVILDTSTGYGGRLIGFLASGRRKYIGIDPNTDTVVANERMVAELGRADRVQLICAPAEDVPAAALDELADFAFTSPPYFRKEHYSDATTQSWKRYPEAGAWRAGFLAKMLALQFAALKPGARSIVNINDVKLKGERYPLVDWTIEEAKRAGFVFEDREVFPMSNHFGKGNDERGEVAVEPVLIFRKPL
jgi:ParB-like chromosome segregation protein Spo0J